MRYTILIGGPLWSGEMAVISRRIMKGREWLEGQGDMSGKDLDAGKKGQATD